MSPETTQSQAPTNIADALIQLAEAQNVIREKEGISADLTTKITLLKAEVERYEVAKAEVSKEVAGLANELETTKKAIATQSTSLNESFDAREAKLKDKEAEIELREEEHKAKIIEISQRNAESNRLAEENAKVQADIDSKLLAVKGLKANRDNELATLEATRTSTIIEQNKLEVLRTTVQNETEEKRQILIRIQESEKNATDMHEIVTKERQALELLKGTVAHESASADYNLGMARNLTACFRQALHTYAQIAGTGIQIPELTEEHKIWIAKDLLAQCGISDFHGYGEPKGEEDETEVEILSVEDSVVIGEKFDQLMNPEAPVEPVTSDAPTSTEESEGSDTASTDETIENTASELIPETDGIDPTETIPVPETPITEPTDPEAVPAGAPVPEIPETRELTNNEMKSLLAGKSVEVPKNANGSILREKCAEAGIPTTVTV